MCAHCVWRGSSALREVLCMCETYVHTKGSLKNIPPHIASGWTRIECMDD
jgi:hypothetical protein